MRSGLTEDANDSGKPPGATSVALSNEEIVEQLTEYFTGIRDILHEITPLQSRWNGRVQIEPNIAESANALFLPDGTIVVAPRLIYKKVRWRTLIHEMIHSLGVPVSKEDYEAEKGWEEGFVEYTQRRLRPVIMGRLGIAYDEAFIAGIEPTWRYQAYVVAAEAIIAATGEEGLTLCYDVLRQPIKVRSAFLIRRFRSQAMLLSQQSAALRQKILGGTMNRDEKALWDKEEP